jgi:hypothetical protein
MKNCVYCGAEPITTEEKTFCTNCGDTPTKEHQAAIIKYCHTPSGHIKTRLEMVTDFRSFYLLPIGLCFDDKNPQHIKALKQHSDFMYSEIVEYIEAKIANDRNELLDAIVDILYFLDGAEVHLGVDVLKYFVWVDYVLLEFRRSSGFEMEEIEQHYMNVHVANMNKSDCIGGIDYPIFQYLNPTYNPERYDEFKIDFRQGRRLDKWINHSKGKVLKGSNFSQPYFND